MAIVQDTTVKPNAITGVEFIPLYYRGEIVAYAMVDTVDYEWLSQTRWCLFAKYVATSTRVNGSRYMHRIIMQDPENAQVDHINGDKLDNRRSNLRICTSRQNKSNVGRKNIPHATSEYIGVCYIRRKRKWCASVLDGKKVHRSMHRTEIEAAKWRDAKAYELRGEFARLNFPEDYNQ